MNQNLTDITVVLDRSGSMQAVRSDTIGGFNAFLAEQKAAPGRARLTLVQFDNHHEVVVHDADIQHVAPLTEESFVPRGGTALLDALGRTIESTGARLRSLAEKNRPGKVVMVVITDGEENASHAYSQSGIAEMIQHQSEKYAWKFLYLGANQDAFTVSTAYGIPMGQAANYVSNAVGSHNAFVGVASAVSNLRGLSSGDYIGSTNSMSTPDVQNVLTSDQKVAAVPQIVVPLPSNPK